MSQLTQILTNHNISWLRQGIAGQINQQLVEYATISGADAIQVWQLIRNSYQQFLPVIIQENICQDNWLPSYQDQINKDLENFTKIEVQKWVEQCQEDYNFDDEEDELAEIFEEMEEELKAPIPKDNFSIPYDVLTRQPLSSIAIVLFPKIEMYLIPIYLQYGGWNNCPRPDEQAAILKYWQSKYDIEWFGVTNDVIEFQVNRPPTNFEEAFILAQEQMYYCDDLVFQGTMTVKRLAECLINNKVWYFWWD